MGTIKKSRRVLAKRGVVARRPVLGWREWASLPGLGVKAIKLKVDTGAKTSALHAFNLRPFRKGGEDWVEFDVRPMQRDDGRIRHCACPTHDYRWVTNSGGGREKRFVIKTALRLGSTEWPIEITLTDRDQMGFRMLLGRSAIEGYFAVDPAKSYTLGKKKRKRAARRKAKRLRSEEE